MFQEDRVSETENLDEAERDPDEVSVSAGATEEGDDSVDEETEVSDRNRLKEPPMPSQNTRRCRTAI